MENKTMKELEILAKQNNYDAIFEIGTRYLKIDNYSKAINYFKIAADNGHEKSIKMIKKIKEQIELYNLKNTIGKEIAEISSKIKKVRTRME